MAQFIVSLRAPKILRPAQVAMTNLSLEHYNKMWWNYLNMILLKKKKMILLKRI